MNSLISVLAIANRTPFPPIDGGRKAALGMLKSLAVRSEVVLRSLVMVDSREDQPSRKKLEELIGEVHWVSQSTRNRIAPFVLSWLFSGAPYSIAKYKNHQALRRALQIVNSNHVDVVYIEHLSSFWVGEQLRRDFPHLKIVLREQNVETLILDRLADDKSGLLRLVFRDQARRMAAYEAAALHAADFVYAITDVDRTAYIERFGLPPEKICTLPIGLDSVPPMSGNRSVNPQPIALFAGSLEWEPNRMGVAWLVQEVLPRLRKSLGKVKIQLVGKGTEKYSGQFPDLLAASGFVDDIEPNYSQADIAIVPLRSGSGVRVKVLDFMSRGIPVLSTSIGIEGIASAADHDQFALIADEPQRFADELLRLAADAHLRCRLGDAGRAHVERHYNWAGIAETVVSNLRQLCAQAR